MIDFFDMLTLTQTAWILSIGNEH